MDVRITFFFQGYRKRAKEIENLLGYRLHIYTDPLFLSRETANSFLFWLVEGLFTSTVATWGIYGISILIWLWSLFSPDKFTPMP